MIAYMEFEEIESLTRDTMHLPFYEALACVGVEDTDYETVFESIRKYLLEGDVELMREAEWDHATADVEY